MEFTNISIIVLAGVAADASARSPQSISGANADAVEDRRR